MMSVHAFINKIIANMSGFSILTLPKETGDIVMEKEVMENIVNEGFPHSDMSMLDYLAMRVMIQLVANGNANGERVAAISYSIAESMMKQRENKTGEQQ